MVCPKCNQHVDKGDTECICGYSFETGLMRSTSLPSNEVYKKDPTPKEFYQKIGLILDRVGKANIVLYVIGTLTLLQGLIYATMLPEYNVFGSAYISTAIGVLFIVSGVLVQKELPFAFAALIICFVLYCIDTILCFIQFFSNYQVRLSVLYIHVLFLIILVNGIRAFIAVKKMRENQASAA